MPSLPATALKNLWIALWTISLHIAKTWHRSMIFLDANILLEIVLVDRPRYGQVKRLLEAMHEETAISMLTVHLVMHFGRKEEADDAFLHAVLNENKILALTHEDYQWAANYEQGRDFEDALQMAAAIRSHCNSFVTLDQNLLKRYNKLPISIVIPQ